MIEVPGPIDAAGLGCALGYGVLAWAARQPGAPSSLLFFGVTDWASLLTFGHYVYTRGRPPGAIDGRAADRLGGGVPALRTSRRPLLRGRVLSLPQGRVPFRAGRNALRSGTGDVLQRDPSVAAAFQRILNQVNYPELPTIYGPVTDVLFRAGHVLRPGRETALQATLVLIDLVTIVLLLRLAPARGCSSTAGVRW